MISKNLRFTNHLLWAVLAVAPICELRAQAPAAPSAEAAPAGDLDALFSDAEKAFVAKDYATASTKLETLLKSVAANPAVAPATLEMLRFNIGLSYLTANNGEKAETAFNEVIKNHPKGEYTSRAQLGLGRALILQNTPEKKELAINALKQAATDPKYRSEAGLSLGQVYDDLKRPEDAFAVFRSLMGSDVRTPQQTNAAVEVIGLLADSEKIEDLTAYLDRVINQSGVRDAIAWYSNQIIVHADSLMEQSKRESALVLYRSIPPRRQILETQRVALEQQRREIDALEKKVAAEEKLPIGKRSNAGEALPGLKAALDINTEALDAIDKRADLDAALLLRRGRALYFLDRFEEALVCFREIRDKYPDSSDLQAAAYSEIFVYNRLQNTVELQKRAADFLEKHPDSKNIEQVALLAGEGLANAGKWDEVLTFYRNLATKFPNSPTLDRYNFFEGVALFRLGKFAEASDVFTKFTQTFPSSDLFEDAVYQVAMANFVQGKYKETLATCQDYLKRFPTGRYAGDIRYRLSYIDFRDTETDQSQKIIKDINAFVEASPDDPGIGMMLNLLGDTYSQKPALQKLKDSPDKALDAYKRAADTEGADDVIGYALDQATTILQSKKDWAALAELHMGVMNRRPGTNLALKSSVWVVKMLVREGRNDEAAQLLATTLKDSIGDPANEQVEPLLDEMVKTLVPKRTKDAAAINPDDLFKKLTDILNKAAEGKESQTTNARIAYANALLAEKLRLPDRSDLFLKGMAANTDPAVLSPMLLSACGEIMLKDGNLDQAEAMFQRIVDRYQDSSFSDSGPVGLGRVALARKDYQKAYDLFTDAIENNPAMSKFGEATVGKLEALEKLGKLDDAEKLGVQMLGDKQFKGESSGKAYLLLGDVFQARGKTLSGSDKEEALKKANGYYINAFARFKAYPEIAGSGLLNSYKVLTELGLADDAAQQLKNLTDSPKFEKTQARKEAEKIAH
jgi:TolA-binding protein